MKKLLLLAAALVFGTSAVQAQDPSPYLWHTEVIQRVGSNAGVRDDTNRIDLTIPLDIGVSEMRGAGQIIAPSFMYNMLAPILTETSNLHQVPGFSVSDRDWIDQFKDAKAWTLDTVSFTMYKNPNNVFTIWPTVMNFYKINTNFNSAQYQQNGYSDSRISLEEGLIHHEDFDPPRLEGTLGDNDLVNNTIVGFDPPLEFANGESLMMLYINDFADVITQPVPANDTREWQNVIATIEARTGDVVESPPGSGNFVDQRSGNLLGYQTTGVIMTRTNDVDMVSSAYTVLTLNQKPATINMQMIITGTVVLDATTDVRYHFGKDVNEQGLGDVTPNPVRDHARLPFALKSTENVTIELFDANGAIVKTLLDNKKYVTGNYSMELPIQELNSGLYMIRMTAGENNYSMKFTVNK